MSHEIPNWMKIFINQDMIEERDEFATSTQLLDSNGRSFVWWLCKKLSISSAGVMGQSCTLLERFIAKQFKVYSNLSRRSSEWHRIKEEIAERVPLLASVCIAICSKIMSSEQPLNTKYIHQVLSDLDYDYTKAQINAAEIDILAKLDFHIPMFTNVEKATIMATDVGMTGYYIDAVMLVTEVAEYFRSSIQQEIIEVACSFSKDKKIQPRDIANIRHIHLVAGSVIATGMFLKFTGPNPIPRLCFLTQSTRAYIKSLANVIFNHLVIECGINAGIHPRPKHRTTATRPASWKPIILKSGTRKRKLDE